MAYQKPPHKEKLKIGAKALAQEDFSNEDSDFKDHPFSKQSKLHGVNAHIVHTIEAGFKARFYGNVIVINIEENVELEVVGGSLIVADNVGDNVKIKLLEREDQNPREWFEELFSQKGKADKSRTAQLFDKMAHSTSNMFERAPRSKVERIVKLNGMEIHGRIGDNVELYSRGDVSFSVLNEIKNLTIFAKRNVQNEQFKIPYLPADAYINGFRIYAGGDVSLPRVQGKNHHIISARGNIQVGHCLSGFTAQVTSESNVIIDCITSSNAFIGAMGDVTIKHEVGGGNEGIYSARSFVSTPEKPRAMVVINSAFFTDVCESAINHLDYLADRQAKDRKNAPKTDKQYTSHNLLFGNARLISEKSSDQTPAPHFKMK
jgi:hypothetical protein